MFNLLQEYATVIFDCDGVLLDSNSIKTVAFADVARQFGDQAASALQAYHVKNGGVSRYKKFEYLITDILGEKSVDERLVQKLTKEYSEQIVSQLLTCAVTPDLVALRETCPKITWMVVSGSDQAELRNVLTQRGLASLFDGGIYGSPADKDEILSTLFAEGRLQGPALFIGDTKYDHEVAVRARLDFRFAYDWSEFKEWKTYCESHDVKFIKNVAELKLP